MSNSSLSSIPLDYTFYLYQKGYRGFADLGYTIGTGDFRLDRIEFSTSHGYQILPCFYAGLGVGVCAGGARGMASGRRQVAALGH